MKPLLYGSWSRVWGVGSFAVMSACLPGTAADFGSIDFERPVFTPPPVSATPGQSFGVDFRPPLNPPPVNPTPAPLYTIDFTVTGSTVNATDSTSINIPKFGGNDFSPYGGSGLGFDLAQYGLTKVELKFTVTFMADMRGENEDIGNSVEYTYSLPLTSTFSYPNSGSEVLVPTITSAAEAPITLGVSDGVLDYDGPSGYGAPIGEGSDSATSASSLFDAAPPGDLAPYIGSGNWSVNIASLLGTLTSTPTSLFKAGYEVPMMFGRAQVIYTYEAIPESKTIIAASALMGLVAFGRWRSVRQAAAKNRVA